MVETTRMSPLVWKAVPASTQLPTTAGAREGGAATRVAVSPPAASCSAPPARADAPRRRNRGKARKVGVWTLASTLSLFLSAEGLARAGTGWVGTWAASPQSSSTTFNQQTLRQIVHTTITGSPCRVQLSNAFGTQAVTVADVHVAARSSGSSVDASTDRTVTFGGQSSTTIPAGAVAVSDPVAFAVTALTDVAISLYLPQSTGPATSHGLGQQTNYVASGDVSANATLTNPTTSGSYYFLANLDVQSPAAAGAVVTLGASITDGFASTSDANLRWPNDLATRLAGSGRTVGVLNQGISGNQLLMDGAGQSALNRFDRDVLSQPGVAWVILSDDPINDLGSGAPPTSAQLIAGITELISRAHQKGIKFLCSTLTPYEGAGYWTTQGETAREAVNAFIRGPSSGCDGIVDQDGATHDPSAPTKYLPAYDSGDHLHPNDSGYRAIANAVDLTLFDPPTAPADAGVVTEAGAEGGAEAGTPVDAGSGEANDAAGDGGAASANPAAGSPSGEGGPGGPAGGGGCATTPRGGTGGAPVAIAWVALASVARRRRKRSNRS
jgi:lysophospholipase L1-like esterase